MLEILHRLQMQHKVILIIIFIMKLNIKICFIYNRIRNAIIELYIHNAKVAKELHAEIISLQILVP